MLRVAACIVGGAGGDQVVGQIAQLHVVVDQPVYPVPRKALRCEREEEALLVGGLVQHLVTEVGDERFDLAVRPPPGTERGADGSFAVAHLLQQDGMLVSETMVADPVVVPMGDVAVLGRRGRGLLFHGALRHHRRSRSQLSVYRSALTQPCASGGG